MRSFSLLTTLSATLALAACSGDLSNTPHSVDAYLADSTLAAATAEACRPQSAAEYRELREKEACKNVRTAQLRRMEAEREKSQAAFNDELGEALRKRREERRARAQALAGV